MSKFKVGDKVKILDGSKIEHYAGAWNKTMMGEHVGEVHEITQVNEKWGDSPCAAYELDVDGLCSFCKWDERGLELVKSKMSSVYGEMKISPKIVITTDGKTTTAVLYEGKQRIKSAKAKCAPDDEFDFNKSAAIALERLTGQIYGKVENTLFDWDGFKAGKFNVVVNRDNIDRFLEECEKHGINWGHDKATKWNPIKKFDEEPDFITAILRAVLNVESTDSCDCKVEDGYLHYSFTVKMGDETVVYD